MRLPKSFTTVTTFSKILAMTLLVLLPFLGFLLGMKYRDFQLNLYSKTETFPIGEKQQEGVGAEKLSVEELDKTWQTHEGKYISFNYPSEWRAELLEDTSSEDMPTDPHSRARGFTSLKLFNNQNDLILKFTAIDGIGGLCSDFYVFPDSSPSPEEKVRQIIGDFSGRTNPRITLVKEYKEIFTLLGHRVRSIQVVGSLDYVIFVEKDNDLGSFDTDCGNMGMTNYKDADLFVQFPDSYQVDLYGLKISRDYLEDEDKIALIKKIMESFKVIDTPSLKS